MRNLVLIIIIVCACYIVWCTSKGHTRDKVLRALRVHGPWIGVLIAAVLLLAAITYHVPSSSIL